MRRYASNASAAGLAVGGLLVKDLLTTQKHGGNMRTILIATIITATGCSTLGDGVLIAGTPEGIRSWMDGQNAIIANTKTKASDGSSAAYTLRHAQEREETIRQSGGFWKALLTGDKGGK
jgi:hypothetical protein